MAKKILAIIVMTMTLSCVNRFDINSHKPETFRSICVKDKKSRK